MKEKETRNLVKHHKICIKGNGGVSRSQGVLFEMALGEGRERREEVSEL